MAFLILVQVQWRRHLSSNVNRGTSMVTNFDSDSLKIVTSGTRNSFNIGLLTKIAKPLPLLALFVLNSSE